MDINKIVFYIKNVENNTWDCKLIDGMEGF